MWKSLCLFTVAVTRASRQPRRPGYSPKTGVFARGAWVLKSREPGECSSSRFRTKRGLWAAVWGIKHIPAPHHDLCNGQNLTPWRGTKSSQCRPNARGAGSLRAIQAAFVDAADAPLGVRIQIRRSRC
jgi:hypothetical protein